MVAKPSAFIRRGDLFGGLTAGIVALPLALAFGVSSGAGPAAGLYGAIALGFMASLFGGTPTQISGPTGPMTVIAASALAAFAGNFQAIAIIIVLCGVFQIAFGVFRLGGFVRFIPYPVISGFMNGIGVIIILLQLHPLLGGEAVTSPLASLMGLGTALAHTSLPALGFSCLTLAIVFFCPVRVTRVLPSPLIALLVVTPLAALSGAAVPVIGDIPSGLPMPSLPAVHFNEMGRILGLAFTLALLGTIDSLLTSIVADSITKTRHNSNRELVGQGLGNMLAGFVGGLPGAGATMRTVVNIKAGGSTRASGIIHSLFLLALLFGLGPHAAKIPLCVLAGILVKVGVDIIDYRLLFLARKAPRQDLAVMLAVFGITVFIDLIVAVGVGITLSAFMVTYRLARQTSIRVTEAPNGTETRSHEQKIQDDTDFGIRVVSIRGPFFFGTATQMQDKTAIMLGSKVVIFNCLNVPFIDVSGAFALSEMVGRLKGAGVRVLVTAKPEHMEQLRSLGLGDLLAEEDFFTDHKEALAAAQCIVPS